MMGDHQALQLAHPLSAQPLYNFLNAPLNAEDQLKPADGCTLLCGPSLARCIHKIHERVAMCHHAKCDISSNDDEYVAQCHC